MNAQRRGRGAALGDADRVYEALLRDLPNMLGESYRVSAGHQYNTGGRIFSAAGPVPDLVVRSTDEGSTAVLEIKGGPGSDIPLATAPELAGIRARYGDKEGRRAGAVLLGLSPVPALLKDWLLEDGVQVIEIAEGGDEVLPRVRKALRHALKASPKASQEASASYAALAPRGFGRAAAPGEEMNRMALQPEAPSAVATVEVEAPVAQVYEYWRNLENLPSFMKNIEEVRSTGPDTTHWVVKGPLGYRAEFDARTTQDEPNSAIGWNTVDGDAQTSGQVRFEEVGPNRTRLEVQMKYADPPAGRLGEAASRLTSGSKTIMEQDLKNFKDIIEGRDIPQDSRWYPAALEREDRSDRPDEGRPPWERPGPLLAGGALLAWLLLRGGRSNEEGGAEDDDGRLALLLAGGASLIYLLLRRPSEPSRGGRFAEGETYKSRGPGLVRSGFGIRRGEDRRVTKTEKV